MYVALAVLMMEVGMTQIHIYIYCKNGQVKWTSCVYMYLEL